MRNLQECQAEVFRRSEKRIRKRRRRILAACVPLALLVALLGAVRVMPGRSQGNFSEGPTGAVMNGLPEYVQESQTLSADRIEVSGPDVALTYTDGPQVQRICDGLRSCQTRDADKNSVPEAETESAESTQSEDCWDDWEYAMPDSPDAGYTITVMLHDGSAAQYRLEGTTLENKTTAESFLLTQSQTNELMELLGIPAP